MGFDPLNEPMVSNFVTDATLLQAKNFDLKKLQPLYERIYKVYQKYDPQTIMHFETGQVPNIQGVNGGVVNPVGFDRLPGKQKAVKG